MTSRSKNAPWSAALVVTAVIAAGGTWFVLDRDTTDPVGEPTAAATTSDTTAESEDGPSWLFSQTSEAGTFSTEGGVSTLTLTDVDPGVIGFTDRPDRDTVVIPVASFVEAWPTMFADSAPNAVLVEHQPNGDTDSFVVVLSDPRLDGNSLSFTAEVLEGEDHSDIPGLTDTPHTNPPAAFQTVSLFIDDVAAPSEPEFVCVAANGRPLVNPVPIPQSAGPAVVSNFEEICHLKSGTVKAIG